MYFGASFSRYGFDFRPLFIEFFSQTALTNFQNSLQDANHAFQQLLQSYTFDQSVQIPSTDMTINPFIPPMILVSYTPLAAYCNALLTAFNDLRLCCPLAIVLKVKDLTMDSLMFIRNLLMKYYNSEKVTLTVIESEHFMDFLRVFMMIFLPYVSTCMQALFPDAQLAKELGVSVLDVSEKSKLNRIDIEQIIEPMKNIIDSVGPKKTPALEVVPVEEVQTVSVVAEEQPVDEPNQDAETQDEVTE